MRDPFDVLGRDAGRTAVPSPAFVAELMAAVEERLDNHSGTERATSDRPRAVPVIDPEVAPMHRAPSPQRRWLFVAAAVALVAAAAVMLTGRDGDGTDVPAAESTAPSAPTTVAATATLNGSALPTELRGHWMSGDRDVTDGTAGISLVVSERSFDMSQSNENGISRVRGVAVAVDDGTIEVVTRSVGDRLDCDLTESGTYEWGLSPSGRTLTLSLRADPCGARSAALVGTYWRNGCFDTQTNCLGPLDPGTYASQYVTPLRPITEAWKPAFGAVRYTVPDGWANTTDYPYVLGFAWADEYATVTGDKPYADHEINIVTDARLDEGTRCDNTPLGRDQTAAAFLDRLEARQGVTLGERTPVTVGGLPGLQVDVTADASAYLSCDGEQVLALLNGGDFGFGVFPDQSLRLVVLDRAPSIGNGLTAIIVQGTADRWDQFLVEAATIIGSLSFQG